MLSVAYGSGTGSIGRNHVSVRARSCSPCVLISSLTASAFPASPGTFKVPMGVQAGGPPVLGWILFILIFLSCGHGGPLFGNMPFEINL